MRDKSKRSSVFFIIFDVLDDILMKAKLHHLGGFSKATPHLNDEVGRFIDEACVLSDEAFAPSL
ncbi:MAG: hypothetical protein II428_05120, partial [Muribaculaceae bacterium]|nr:hypothetical protein [Muribaculaceae bacterium]